MRAAARAGSPCGRAALCGRARRSDRARDRRPASGSGDASRKLEGLQLDRIRAARGFALERVAGGGARALDATSDAGPVVCRRRRRLPSFRRHSMRPRRARFEARRPGRGPDHKIAASLHRAWLYAFVRPAGSKPARRPPSVSAWPPFILGPARGRREVTRRSARSSRRSSTEDRISSRRAGCRSRRSM